MQMTVRQVARYAGVSVRTLHYYDEIGLLRPASLSAAGYRLYGADALLRLQQILFYREIGLPLRQIKSVLDDADFSAADALRAHRRELCSRKERLERLIRTIDRTLQASEGGTPMEPKEMFEGFGQRMVEENEAKYGKEIREKYGDEAVDRSNAIVAGMDRAEFEALQREGDEIHARLAALMDGGPDAPEAAEAIERFAAHVRRFGTYTDAALVGLGEMYVEDARFKAFYEDIAPGLAEFVRDALRSRFAPRD